MTSLLTLVLKKKLMNLINIMCCYLLINNYLPHLILLLLSIIQLVLANVPIEGCMTVSYKHGLLGGPGDGMSLPTHYGEIVPFGMMA